MRKIMQIAGGLVLILVSWMLLNNDYTTQLPIEVTVVDKQIVPALRTANFSIVYADTQTGEMFDRFVSHTTFATSQIGTVYTIDIRPSDIKQTPTKNFVFRILPVLLIVGTILYWVVTMLFWVLSRAIRES